MSKTKSSKAGKKEATAAPKGNKEKIIVQFHLNDNDTGSPEVQIALLSSRIESVSKHLTDNPNDKHTRRGLLGIISKRRRMLKFLEGKSEERYKEVIKKVGLKK
ncbi:MAG: 30S ribosomal protein S15 [bacterium]|nr:30S ribosomal protein S15 [bacterium]